MTAFIDQLQWLQWPAIAVLLLLAAAVLAARISAWRGVRHPLTLIEDPGPPGAKELVVLVHGYARGARSMEGVRRAVREVRPQADIALFDYNRQWFSNADAFRIAEEMDRRLEELQQAHGYERLVLVSYSMGALLARKAYVYGCGSVADAPMTGSSRATSRAPHAWALAVKRFVLLAGMNRGWNPEYRAKYAPPPLRWAARALWRLARLTRTGLLIRQVMRGEPFVANLRLQWLEVMRGKEAAGIERPRVIQMSGDRDDVVLIEDHRDVTVCRDFILVTVHNTSHPEMVQVGDSGTALERKRKIQDALGDEQAIERLRHTSPVLSLPEDPQVSAVVFVLHGIRDMGNWTSEFEAPLQTAYMAQRRDGRKLHVYRPSYGYFPMGPFLLWTDRQKNVRWFMDQVTELTAQFPNLEALHFIGHSNGTYVLASALEKYRTLRVDRVVLAGSVIRRDFRWSEYSGRLRGGVRNYVGSRDLVVGLFPRLFEIPPFNLFNRDIGSAGFNGFEDGIVQPMETRFVPGGHGAALDRKNVASIVDFIIHGRKTDALVVQRPAWLGLASNTCWLVWLGLVLLILVGGRYAPDLVNWIAGHGGSAPTPVIAWSSRGAYGALIWLLLKTV